MSSGLQAFTTLEAIAAPYLMASIDTDKLIPHKFLRKPLSAGYRNFLFYDQRFDENGTQRGDFILDREPFTKSGILVSGGNFGCGSTREGAVYALLDFGIRCVIATSFSDIFYANCLQNGLLPVVLPEAEVEKLCAYLEANPGAQVGVDLPSQTVTTPTGAKLHFEIDGVRKEQMLKGLDDIGVTQQYSDAIDKFESQYRARHPWLFRKQDDLVDRQAQQTRAGA